LPVACNTPGDEHRRRCQRTHKNKRRPFHNVPPRLQV
jgi:hypothetical protein